MNDVLKKATANLYWLLLIDIKRKQERLVHTLILEPGEPDGLLDNGNDFCNGIYNACCHWVLHICSKAKE